jgi:hypothetical protein
MMIMIVSGILVSTYTTSSPTKSIRRAVATATAMVIMITEMEMAMATMITEMEMAMMMTSAMTT